MKLKDLTGAGQLGWVQRGILWHLMEQGIATCPQLAEAVGTDQQYARKACQALEQRGFVRAVATSEDVRGKWRGLTPKGIDVALHVTPEDWQGREPRA